MELTQDFTIFAEGTHQTVQEWLTISNAESAIIHPEDNYQNVVGIWNSSIETEESMTDEEIMTLLQGPLRLPRSQRCGALKMENETPNIGTGTNRCSSSLLLFCYYFMFQQDPYGHQISKAWLHSSSFKHGGPVPLYEYLRQYWHSDKWLGMLSHCNDLDFHGLAQRQQEKFAGLTCAKAWDCERGKWYRKMTASFKFGGDGDGEWGVWIGPLDNCQAVFQFEDFDFLDETLVKNNGSEKMAQNLFPPVLATGSPVSKVWPGFVLDMGLKLVKALRQQVLVGGVIITVTLLYWLYL